MKKPKIQESLNKIEQRLRDAEEYIARNVNVESRSFLHLKDWKGKSGHPLWMKNHMIPVTERARAYKEKVLERITAKKKERKLQQRRNTPKK